MDSSVDILSHELSWRCAFGHVWEGVFRLGQVSWEDPPLSWWHHFMGWGLELNEKKQVN